METLEEAAERYAEFNQYDLAYHDEGGYQGIDTKIFAKNLIDFTNKWQAERMYSEEDLISFYNFLENHQLRKYGDVWKRITNDPKDKPLNFESVDDQYIIEWFDQFKKQ